MKKKYLYLTLVVIWMIVIFYFSSQEATQSQGLSNGVIAYLEKLFHLHIINANTPIEAFVSFFVRKAAHMSEYAILGMLLYLCLYHSSLKQAILVAFCIAVLYAGSDEIHQLFVEGRSGQLFDVGVDSIGVMLGLCIQQAWFYVYWKYKGKV